MAEAFGRFWLHEKIGQGGSADVYRATMGPDAQTYAFEFVIKRLRANLRGDLAQIDNFLTEADVAKFLKHPNLMAIYDCGMLGDEPYIALEYIWGFDLATFAALLRRRHLRFPSDLAVYVTMQVLRALDYVHRARTATGLSMEIVHRDVTPSNIYITFDGQVKLGDFGAARISFLEAQDDPELAGKIAYMPPEVLMGENVTQRADLWSLSVTLYEMLVGRRLYEGTSADDLLAGRAARRIPSVHRINPDVDPALSQLLTIFLHKNPKKRPASALQFYRLLKLYLRDTGVSVDHTALGRFVTASASRGPGPRRTTPQSGLFQSPAYLVPIELTPSQRLEVTRRRGRRLSAMIAGGVVVLLTAMSVLVWRGKTTPPDVADSAPLSQAAPAEKVVNVPPPVPVTREPDKTAVPRVVSDLVFEDETVLSDPNTRFRALMHRGQVQAKRGKYASAAEAFHAAAVLKPASIQAHLGWAQQFLAMGKIEEAEKVMTSAKRLQSEHQGVFLLSAKLQLAKNDKEGAKLSLQKAIERDPASAIGQHALLLLESLQP